MLYAISDLHLSLTTDPEKIRKMDGFGEHWQDHHLKIEENWRKTVSEEDTVLICGDVSWAQILPHFDNDAAFLMSLPGKKIITRGNHDHYFQSSTKMNRLYPELKFLKNEMTEYISENGDIICICSIKGSLCPNDYRFFDHDKKIYRREQIRLRTLLKRATERGYKHILLAIHYPVMNDKREESGFIELIREYGVKTVVYGHLHNKESHDKAMTGLIQGVQYHLTSADYVNFTPVKIF